MFERFTNEARRVIVVAQDEARNLDHRFIEPQHILLGLLQAKGVAAKALGQLGVDLETVRAAVAASIAPSVVPGQSIARELRVPFSRTAKKSLELSLREALQLGHNYIGTEHIALGVLRATEETDVVFEVLGSGADELRSRVRAVMDSSTATLPMSPALVEAFELARRVAAPGPTTTGQLLLAMVADDASHAAKALEALGVTAASLPAQLAQIPLDTTSDASPRPVPLEIRIGPVSATIDDPDLIAALGDLTPEQLGAALRAAVGPDAKRAPGPTT